MRFEWKKYNEEGYKLSLVEKNTEFAYLYCWLYNDNTLRINWLMTYKDYQKLGFSKKLLEEFKENHKKYFFGDFQSLVFQTVTSKGVAKLISDVFNECEIYISENFSENMIESILERKIEDFNNLPSLSPAKYNSDGSSSISKFAKNVDLKVKL